MFGAKAERHVILFKLALLVAKKRDDVTMSVKAFIEVTQYCREYFKTSAELTRVLGGGYN